MFFAPVRPRVKVFTLEPDRPCDAGLLWSTVVSTRNDDKSHMMMGLVLAYT